MNGWAAALVTILIAAIALTGTRKVRARDKKDDLTESITKSSEADQTYVDYSKIPEGMLDYVKLMHTEYLKLFDHIEDYDKRVLGFKSWMSFALTFMLGSAAIAPQAATSEAQLVHRAALWAVVLLSSGIWFLEASWKIFQYSYEPRINELEKWFGSAYKDPPPKPCQMNEGWKSARVKWWRPLEDLGYQQKFKTIQSQSKLPWIFDRTLLVACCMMLPFVCIPYLPLILLALVRLFWW